MRAFDLLRLLMLALLVLAGSIATVSIDSPTIALADDGGEDDDGNEGEGNGDDDDDDGNRGRGNDDKEKKDKKNDKVVTASAGYAVEVTCEPTDDGTTCTFTPGSPADGKEVSQLLVPEAALCSDVLETDAEFVDPDPNMHETGYKSRGNEGIVVLDLEGTVATDDVTTTYWVKAADTVYPATGPALTCDVAATTDESTTTATADAEEPAATEPAGKSTPEPTAPPEATTGTVVVETYACTDVPADTAEFDWFGLCTPDTAAHRFLLAPTSDETALMAAQTDGSGAATFADLATGTYNLDDADARWCHAESDRVDTNGNVVVEAGATTTVWLFYCNDGGA